MSQAGILNVAGGGGGGSPIQTITGNDSTAVPPTANNIFLLGGTSTTNNANGIVTSGNVGTSTETISLTNRITGSGNTAAGETITLATFPLGATPGAYNVEAKFVGFNSSGPNATGYTVIGTLRTDGATATLVSIPDETPIEDISLITSDVNFVVSGNNLLFQAVGVVGFPIHWLVVATFQFIS